jgi:hypothetical protein
LNQALEGTFCFRLIFLREASHEGFGQTAFGDIQVRKDCALYRALQGMNHQVKPTFSPRGMAGVLPYKAFPLARQHCLQAPQGGLGIPVALGRRATAHARVVSADAGGFEVRPVCPAELDPCLVSFAFKS